MIAGSWVFEGMSILRSFTLAMAASRTSNIVGEYWGGKGRGIEHSHGVESLRDTGGGIGHGFIARPRALPLELHFHFGLQSVEAETFPAMLDFDIG